MKETPQFLLEADKCFQWVCEKIKQDGINPRSVLFGSTLQEWLNQDIPKIIITGEPPNASYLRAFLRSER